MPDFASAKEIGSPRPELHTLRWNSDLFNPKIYSHCIHIHIPSKSFKKLRHIILVRVSSPSIYFFGQNLKDSPSSRKGHETKSFECWIWIMTHPKKFIHNRLNHPSLLKNSDSTPGNQDFPGMNLWITMKSKNPNKIIHQRIPKSINLQPSISRKFPSQPGKERRFPAWPVVNRHVAPARVRRNLRSFGTLGKVILSHNWKIWCVCLRLDLYIWESSH